jgi:hypothetical protein
MTAFEPTRTVAIGTVSRNIVDNDNLVYGKLVIPEGSTVFVTRLAYTPSAFPSHPLMVYASVAEVAITDGGVVTGWRLHIPTDAVRIFGERTLEEVADSFSSGIAEACEDEAVAG